MLQLCKRCNIEKKLYLFPKFKGNPMQVCRECRYGIINLDKARRNIETKIIKKEGCWDWIGSITTQGYGEMHYTGRHHNAHRIAYRVYVGEIPEGMLVLHKCDNRLCCNPEHLFLGTSQDNSNDMFRKGRNRVLKGHECSYAKLTENQVREIRKLIKEGQGPTMISKKFNVRRGVISDIRLGKTYKNVS